MLPPVSAAGAFEDQSRTLRAKVRLTTNRGDDRMREGRREHQEAPHEQEEKSAAFVDRVGRYRVLFEADRIIETVEDHDGRKRIPRELDQDVRDHKNEPAVSPGRALSNLVQSALGDELRPELRISFVTIRRHCLHYLLREISKYCEQEEDGEHFVLQALLGIVGLE
jgi:hypothetical protein